MLSVSEAYSQAIVADSREMPYRVKLAGSVMLDRSRVTKMTLNESVSGSDGVSIGTSNSATLNLVIRDADEVDYDGMLVEPESGLVLPDGSIEWIPLGKFWVTESSTNNDYKKVNLTCADGMYLLTGDYISDLIYPTDVKNVAREIAAKTGITIANIDELPDVVIRRKPTGFTYREAVGYIAGCCARNARFNRLGSLEFVWYTPTSKKIERTTQYIDGMTKLNNKALSVNFQITGAKEAYDITVISDSNGGVSATPGHSVYEGETVVISVNPYRGYELATITAVTEHGDDVALYKSAEGGYTFVQPDSNVTVTASFRTSADGPFTLTVRAFDNGSISHDGGTEFNAGDKVTIYVTPYSDYKIDRLVTIPANITLENKGNGTYELTFPESDVTINAYFKLSEDETKKSAYSWMQMPQSAPTTKPYWAVFYNESDTLPTCQKYYLIWFDSWKVTGQTDEKYTIQFDGYYYCGSKNTGNGSHEWDTSSWSGNGTSGTTLEWSCVVGSMFADWDAAYGPSSRYCLIASNTNLPYLGSVLFEKCETAIQSPQTSYLQNGMDVREKGSLAQWKCPDTYSTPLPASNWMVLMPDSGFYMYIDEYGDYEPHVGSPQTLIALFYDSITIQNVGKLVNGSDEEFYIATPINGHWCYLASGAEVWDELHALPEGVVFGMRSPLVSTEPKSLWGYNIAGILATNRTLYDTAGNLFMYNNACRLCDCSEAAAPMKFALRRSATSESEDKTIVIESELFTATTDGDTIVITSPSVSASSDGDTLIISIEEYNIPSETVTITYTNPLIYEKMVDSISALAQGITYTPAKVKHRGNPAFQAGDIVKVPDKQGTYHTILIMQQTMTFGGGMNSEITCPGKTDKAKSFSSNGPLTAQIKNEVRKSNEELEHRMSVENALVFAGIYKSISSTESKIKSVVEWQSLASATIAALELVASEHEGRITSLVGWQSETDEAIASIEQNVSYHEAEIALRAIAADVDAALELKVGMNELGEIESAISITADKLTIIGDNFSLEDGKIKATDGEFSGKIIANDGGKIGDWSIVGGKLVGNHLNANGSLVEITPNYVRALELQDETTAIQMNWHEIMSVVLFVKNNRQEIINALGKLKQGVSRGPYTYRTTDANQVLTFTDGILTRAEDA